MALATITSKGQVTIPKEIRERLKLRTGDKIEIVATAEHTALIRPLAKKVDDLFCRLRKPGQRPVPVEELDRAIADRMKERFK